MRARSSSLTPSLPASPLETETVLIPSRFAISDIRTDFAMVGFPFRTCPGRTGQTEMF